MDMGMVTSPMVMLSQQHLQAMWGMPLLLLGLSIHLLFQQCLHSNSSNSSHNQYSNRVSDTLHTHKTQHPPISPTLQQCQVGFK